VVFENRNLGAILIASTQAESLKNPGKTEDTGTDSYYPELGGGLGSFVPSQLNMLFNLFPKTATWRIAEIRPGKRSDGDRFFDTFAAVSYPQISEAPSVGSRALSKTIVKFVMEGPPLFYVGYPSRIADADEFTQSP
jgi:hypothetical protein